MIKVYLIIACVAPLAVFTIGFTNELTTYFEENIAMAMISQSNVSIVTMPLPIRLAVCKLMQVSRGSARDEMVRAFGFIRQYNSCHAEVSGMTGLLQSFTIILLNKIYVNDTKDLDPYFFQKSSTDTFGVHVEKKKFNRPRSALAYINRWFEIVSLKRITDILDNDEVSYNSSILAVSAAHIKSTWARPFSILKTKSVKFRTPNNSLVAVQMMTMRGSFFYHHDMNLHFQIVSIPLISYGMSMTFLLPDAPDKFGTTAKMLLSNPTLLQNARKNMKYQTVGISLPRFRIKSTHRWDDVLKLLGILQIFNSTNSGLDGLLKSHDEVRAMYLSVVKQMVVLEVDEMGAFRMGIAEDDNELDKKYPLMKTRKTIVDFMADRPFFFSIDMQVSNRGDQSMLLVGAYYGPNSD